MEERYSKRKIPYSKLPLAKLKEIESNIIKKNPDIEKSLHGFSEDEKNLGELRENIEGIRNRIAEIRSKAIQRNQQEYAATGILKKSFASPKTHLTELEIAEVSQLQEQLFRLSYRYDSNKYSSDYEERKRLSRIQTIISQKEKKEVR
jgi:hypothetical protein